LRQEKLLPHVTSCRIVLNLPKSITAKKFFQSKFNPQLRGDTLLERVLDEFHFRYEVGGVD
jgi:hypothetical protein